MDAAIADRIFGKQEDVISLLREGKWEQASRFGDYVSYNAAINNEEWWWIQIRSVINTNPSDRQSWNSCSYGNLAMAIYYGEKFPDRSVDVEKLKNMFS